MTDEEKLPHEDERGSRPPAEEGDADEGSEGPAGNPAQDEEALSHRQQERESPGGD